jgi:hypothetical protein
MDLAWQHLLAGKTGQHILLKASITVVNRGA